MHLSVIIPAYNEEKRIEKTLSSVYEYLKNKKYEYEIIVVSDGSKDRTAEVVASRFSEIPGLELLDLPENRGKGHAVRIGMLRAIGEYKLFMDADNSTSLFHLDQFLPYFQAGCDIVISSRQRPDSKLVIRQPWMRRFLGSIWRGLVRAIVPLHVSDSQNGFKAFTKQAADLIFPKQTVWGWAFDVEILAIARKCGLTIKEVGVEWHNDERSKLNTKGMILMLHEVAKIRLNLILKKYD